jgi:hypothetical protein
MRPNDFSYSLCCQDTAEGSYEQYPLIKKDRSAPLSTSLFLTIGTQLNGTMAALEDTVAMMGELTIANSTCHQDTHQNEVELRKNAWTIVRVTQQMTRNAKYLLRCLDTAERIDESLTTLNSLSKDTARLTDIMASLDDTSAELVNARISSLTEQDSEVSRLLSYFKEELETITRNVLGSATDGQPKFLRILEGCYKQALDISGVLHYDKYHIYSAEAALGSLYDPDYQSAEYHEHENRMQVDKNYAKAHYVRMERLNLEEEGFKQKAKRAWINFWSQALQKCPDGPTLFVPAGTLCSDDLPQASRYLFRAFDSDSSGLSNDTLVSSAASIRSDLEADHLNILSLDKKDASQRMHEHLNKRPFGGSASDNLMSWSNSLLFIIQYAIWRSQQRGWFPAKVYICAVDTNKFPKGQFVRDMWLISKCYDTSWENNPLDRLIKLRQGGNYYNGEHLSQGTVNHKGRFCVFSLQDLIDAGLCELYPELGDPEGRNGWAKRVLALRSMWAFPDSTTQYEIHLAVQLAKLCFPGMATLDIALMFLTFRRRNLGKGLEREDGKFDSM